MLEKHLSKVDKAARKEDWKAAVTAYGKALNLAEEQSFLTADEVRLVYDWWTELVGQAPVDHQEKLVALQERVMALAERHGVWLGTRDCVKLDEEELARASAAHPEIAHLRQAAVQAFAALEQEGIFARDRYACCMNCALDQLSGVVDQRPDLIGAAYWHNQDEQQLWESGLLYIRFVCNPGQYADESEGTLDIGRRVSLALKAQSLHLRWKEDPTAVIEIHAPDQQLAVAR